jgi:hypothetical protein
MNKLKYFFLSLGLLSLSVVILVTATISRAQASDDETVSVDRAELAVITLPSGARQVRDGKIPSEIKDTLSKLIAAGGEGIEEGASEVVLWGGNYQARRGAQMIQSLETAFKNAGWQYEAGEKSAEFTTFLVFRPEPQPRALVGFFAHSEDVFVFAVAEMLKAGGRSAENPSSREKNEVQPRSNNSSSDSSLNGKWFRTVGGGSRDWTGKTQYKAGEDFYFEFFPDGSVTYTREKDVLTIMQCSIKESQKARGRYSVSGNTLKIELGQMTSVGSDSCDAKGNFNKKLEPSTITVNFEIKKMESLSRPDQPTIMCFNGSDEICYEKVNK